MALSVSSLLPSGFSLRVISITLRYIMLSGGASFSSAVMAEWSKAVDLSPLNLYWSDPRGFKPHSLHFMFLGVIFGFLGWILVQETLHGGLFTRYYG